MSRSVSRPHSEPRPEGSDHGPAGPPKVMKTPRLAGENACPTLASKGLRFRGAGAFARRFRLPTNFSQSFGPTSSTERYQHCTALLTLPAGRGFHEKAGPCQAQNVFGSLNHNAHRRPTGGATLGRITTNGDPRTNGEAHPRPTFCLQGTGLFLPLLFGPATSLVIATNGSATRSNHWLPTSLVSPPPIRPASIRTLQWELFAPGASWGSQS